MASSATSEKKKRKVEEENRVFQPHWTLNYFFIQRSDGSPACLICNESISVAKEYNVKRHYETKHADGAYGKLEGEQRNEKIKALKTRLARQQGMFPKTRSDGEKVVRASCVVSHQIAKRLKPYSDGEFIKQCLTDVAAVMCPQSVKEFEKISLSRWTVARRIDSLSEDISQSLSDKIKDFVAWTFATDESTDQKDTAQLAIFVKGVDIDLNETEEFLALQSMKDTTTGGDIFAEVCDAIERFGLDWSKLCGMASDGAPAMSGLGVGLVGRVKAELREKGLNDDIVVFHCIIHQENLCAKTLKFTHVIGPVSQAVNFIRARGFNHRQFQKFLDDLNTSHQDLVYFCEVRWLSKGRMLRRFYDLREEVSLFLTRKGRPMEELNDRQWLCDLAFIVDITTHLNELNVRLQKRGQYANELYGHVKAFQNKLRLWKRQIEQEDLSHFTTLREIGLYPGKGEEFGQQLQKLLDEFLSRFQDFKSHELSFEIFSGPFHTDVDKAPTALQMELIELQERADLKAKFMEERNIGDFYRKSLTAQFPNLRKFIAKKMALFGSTYVCEQFFSKMGYMKSPYRATLTDEHLENGLRVASSTIEPNLDRVVGKMSQFHISH